MELDALKRELQCHLSDGLVLIVGSGLSCAEGIPGMNALGQHLVANISAGLSESDQELWDQVHPLIKADGLEAALLKVAPTPSLEAAIVQSTADFIAGAEANIIYDVFSNARKLRLTRLIPHLLKPDTGIPIITTNYDRLVEVACEEAGVGVDTMFVGHFAARLNPRDSVWSFCRDASLVRRNSVRHTFAPRANVFKPHGSLDWYYREGSPVRYAGSLPLPRLIITPGINKFRNGYESPFDKHREKGNDAIDRAARFLIVGYGFNDDHLETHLTPRIRAGAKTVILTHALSAKSREMAMSCPNIIAIEYGEAGDVQGSNIIVECQGMFRPGINYWDLDGFVEGVLSA